MTTDDMVSRAAKFVSLNARVLDHRRFDLLFREGPAAPVLAALDAYRNDDGGYGHALEPDGRGSDSQPAHVQTALDVLDEIGELTPERAAPICDYLASITGPDGGVPFSDPDIRDYPHAPYWPISEDRSGSMLPTAGIAGLLHRNKISHPWLTAADAFCWRAISEVTTTHPYEVHACLRFLDHAPDRARASSQAERLGELVRSQRLVALSDEDEAPPGYAEGETHKPHDFAPTPDSLAARWFSSEELADSLAGLAAGQQEDGGWPINFAVWTPVTEFEWRPVATIAALKTLRAHS